MDERKLLPHQITQVMIGSTTRAQPVEVFRTDKMITEARLDPRRPLIDLEQFRPDGEWISCNTELFSDVAGHAQQLVT